MTTRITVDAHAGWPVEVTTVDVRPSGTKQTTSATVPPGEVRDFYVFDNRELIVRELPRAD